jgi:hypothetical protein
VLLETCRRGLLLNITPLSGDGDVAIGSSLTFVNEFSAKEFDAFADLVVAVVQTYVLTNELVDVLE